MASMGAENGLILPHVRQSYNWDCGLACCTMILRYAGIAYGDLSSVLKSLTISTSVWTIDLAHILYHYGIKSSMHTLTFEVNQDYQQLTFYKDKISEDTARVAKLFTKAVQLGLNCTKGQLSLEEFQERLTDGQKVAIVLVDANFLQCLECGSSFQSKCAQMNCCCVNSYQGHFIVVTGCNLAEDRVYYQNPATRVETCICTTGSFDIARRAEGTDEDVLFIDLDSSSRGG